MAPPLSTESSLKLSGPRSRTTYGAPTAIVIGSGFAGLGAARALASANFKVVVLESRDRIGGRVHTSNVFGFPVDMGASWLHGVCQENPLAPLIRKLQVPLYRTSGDNSVLYDHDLESYALFDKHGQQVDPEIVARVGTVFEEILEETKKLRVGQEDMSMERALALALERRPELRPTMDMDHNVLQWYLCRLEGWFAADADKISVRHWDVEELLEGGHGLMVRGYGTVLEALAKGLDIRFEHRVAEVIQEGGRARVVTADGCVFEADAVVCTIPVGVLRSGAVRFSPPLPPWKASAIEDVGVGIENKIALLFERAFWPNVDFLGLAASTSYECSYFLNLHKATGRPVLVYMPAGRLATYLEGLPEDQAAAFAAAQLQTILPGAPAPVQHQVSRWASDPNSMGSYTYDAVGKSHQVYERLQAPVGVVHFAGEATSHAYPGTVHGAYATGVLAASDCKRLLAASMADVQLFQPVMAHEELQPYRISRL